MVKIEIIGDPEISEKNIPDEGKHYEIDWELNESPKEDWLAKFDKLIKPYLTKNEPLFGPYKPKIIHSILITAIEKKLDIPKQKDFFEKEFFTPINDKINK